MHLLISNARVISLSGIRCNCLWEEAAGQHACTCDVGMHFWQLFVMVLLCFLCFLAPKHRSLSPEPEPLTLAYKKHHVMLSN